MDYNFNVNNLFIDHSAFSCVEGLIKRKSAEPVPGVRGPECKIQGALFLSLGDDEIEFATKQACISSSLAILGEQEVHIQGTILSCEALVIGSL